MQSYAEPNRPYGEPLGLRLLTRLEASGVDPFSAQDARREAESMGLSRAHTLRLLNQLTTAGRLTRLKRGLYAFNDPVTKQPQAHPFAIGTALVSPSAVSHWSALQHWGLTDQIPATVTLTSPRRSSPPDSGAASSSGHRAWNVAGTRYEIISVNRARFFGAADVWIDERNRVPIFDRERALLDAFQHFHIFGSLSVGLQVLEQHLAALDLDRLIDYALRLRVGAVVKRLGWALSHAEVPPSSLQRLLEYPAKGDTPLDPGRPSRGRHDPVWRVIENLGGG